MTTLGDIEYESGANTASRLAGNTTTTKKYLSQTGNGSVSAAPAWVQVAAADLSDGNTGTGPIVHGTNPAIASPSTTGTDNGSETLQNKTLTGASSGNSVTLLNEQGPVSQLTGNSSAQTMYTYTLAANTLGAGKGVRIRCWVQHTVGSAAISYTIQFGGSSFFTATLVDTATQNEYFESTIFNNTGVTNAQHGIGWGIFAGSGAGLDNPFTAAIDTTAAVIIKATFNVANTDKVTPAEWIVEFVQ